MVNRLRRGSPLLISVISGSHLSEDFNPAAMSRIRWPVIVAPSAARDPWAVSLTSAARGSSHPPKRKISPFAAKGEGGLPAQSTGNPVAAENGGSGDSKRKWNG
jgi:hypothetical protein